MALAQNFRPAIRSRPTVFVGDGDCPHAFCSTLARWSRARISYLLVRGFARWQRHASEADQSVKLILAGAKGWYYDQIFATVRELGLENDVLFPGFVPADELVGWYRAAEGFVYPSRLEGFGLPLLEAMACGTPALCSRAASLLEVAGDATLTFAQDDEDELVAALATLISDQAARRSLRQAGPVQASRFSWSKCAAETVDVYRRALTD